MRLTIIVPAHNEEHRIGPMLDAYLPYFSAKYGVEVEFLVVVNGSTDQTAEVVASYAGRFPVIRSLVEPQPVGKGGALMLGLKAARGELVGFVDADGSTPPEAFDDLVANLGQADAIIASRWCRGAKVSPRQTLDRRIASRIFNRLTRLLFGLRLTDTQCGAKLMRREAAQTILPRLGITQWAFDVDLLFQLRRAGCRIVEIPTEWHDVRGSKLDVTGASVEMALALTRLRLMYSPFRWVVGFYDRFFGSWIHPAAGARDHLLTHSLILMGGAQVGGVLNVAYQLVMVRMLSGDRYGDLAAMLGLLSVVGTPFGALSGAVTHFTSHFVKARTPQKVIGMTKAVAFDLIIPAAVILACAMVGQKWLQVFFNLATPWPILVSGAGAVVMAYGLIPGSMLLGFQSFEWAAFVGVSQPLIRVALGAVLVGIGLSASGALMGHVAGAAVGAALTAWVCYKMLRSQMGSSFAETRGLAEARDLLRSVSRERPPGFYSYAIWFGLAFAGYGVLSCADVVLVKHFFSRDEAGSFAKAAMVARIVFFLPQPIAGALFPKVTSEGDSSPESRRLLLKGLAFAAAVLAVAGGICLAFPGWLLRVMAKTQDPALEPVVRGMVLALAPLALVSLLLNYELAQRRFVVILPLSLCAAAYVGGVVIWHESLMQIVAVLTICSIVCFGAMLTCLSWRQRMLAGTSSAA